MNNGFAIIIEMKHDMISSFGVGSSILLALWSLYDLDATRRKGVLKIHVSLLVLESISQSVKQIL